MARELGIFCGTFNPIHWGHLIMAEMARDQLGLEYVMMITSPNPPHRRKDLLDAESRFELVSAACADNPGLFASRLELDRAGPSYTAETLKQIDNDLKGVGVHLNLIIGEDNLSQIKQWHNSAEIFRLARLVVAPRNLSDAQKENVPKSEIPDANIVWLNIPNIGISSTNIRERVSLGRSILYLVPPKVNEIIQRKGFYK